MSYRALFGRFLAADPNRLHFAAHSHHPWPDVTYDAHIRWWEESALFMDDKWEPFFAEFVPRLRRRLGRLLGLGDGSTIAVAPNTHELINRVFSCLPTPVRLVTTEGEFHSFDRQSRRWEEADVAQVQRVPVEPWDSFGERMAKAATNADFVYLSSVFFDSGFVVSEIADLVKGINDETFVVIDGYHAFMAMPVDLRPISNRVFYLAGGYKYAMAGEGACFMHCPPGYGSRPVDTGWYAGFGGLTERAENVGYSPGGDRFLGATFDPSGLYRLESVLALLEERAITPAAIHAHAGALQERFLASAPSLGELIPPIGYERGNFLTFRTPDAGDRYRSLRANGVVTDYRGDRLRLGFGIYQDPEDVDRLLELL
ncbi:MAG: aminotransferase class V-fold PLP-dependent enzyme [Acidimicrobiia bacterium]